MEKGLTRLRAAVPEEMYVPRRMRDMCVRREIFIRKTMRKLPLLFPVDFRPGELKKKTIYQFLSSARHRTYKSTSDCMIYGS